MAFSRSGSKLSSRKYPSKSDLEHLEVQPLLALEMVVDRRLIDARFGDNGPNACAVKAPLGEKGHRGLDDAVPRVLGRAGHSHPIENSNKCLNSAYALLRAKAIVWDRTPSLQKILAYPVHWSLFSHKRVFEFKMIV